MPLTRFVLVVSLLLATFPKSSPGEENLPILIKFSGAWHPIPWRFQPTTLPFFELKLKRKDVERSLAAKLHAVEAQGCPLRLHWLPSHVNITGNEVVDALAKDAAH
ncbi:uncharacterized protein LOC144177787 [Haemaphysalis longicornis]